MIVPPQAVVLTAHVGDSLRCCKDQKDKKERKSLLAKLNIIKYHRRKNSLKLKSKTYYAKSKSPYFENKKEKRNDTENADFLC